MTTQLAFSAPFTVTQVNQRARALLERQFARVTVVGELSGHKVVSGHHYFCLKDEASQLNAVLFRREAAALGLKLENGMQVVATGRLTIYGPYGRYQIVLERVEPQGAGALQAAFEELKQRLLAEGLFAKERKRLLPMLPKRVGVVSSPTGAVIRDIINVATRRFPRADILLVPSRVQGAEAASSLVAAIERAGKSAARFGLDVLIIARGGGSLEDLWCFNDERVARALAACPIPTVSAVGHETDFTIADWVADCRAPTPSAAAELVFPVHSELVATLQQRLLRCRNAAGRQVRDGRMHLRALRAELGDARTLLHHQAQRLAQTSSSSEEALRRLVGQRRLRLHELRGRLAPLHPRLQLLELKNRLTTAERQLASSMRQRLKVERRQLAALAVRLNALSPLAVLERGYAIVLNEEAKAVRQANDAAPGDKLSVRLARGALWVRVDEVLTDAPVSTDAPVHAIEDDHE